MSEKILREALEAAADQYDKIVTADYRSWPDGLNTPEDFVGWAKSRSSLLAEECRAALGAVPEGAGKAKATCTECRTPLNEGESKCFTVCDDCWDRIYKVVEAAGAGEAGAQENHNTEKAD